MEVKNIILDSLADGSESIIQIQEYFAFLKHNVERQIILSEIESLLKSNLIRISYPRDVKIIEKDKIEDYWFELTELGKQEWDKITEL